MLSSLAITAACVGCCAGQYNDAAYSLVQLRKILEDSNSISDTAGKQVLPGSELAALQTACTSCEAALEEVSAPQGRGRGRGGTVGGGAGWRQCALWSTLHRSRVRGCLVAPAAAHSDP